MTLETDGRGYHNIPAFSSKSAGIKGGKIGKTILGRISKKANAHLQSM